MRACVRYGVRAGQRAPTPFLQAQAGPTLVQEKHRGTALVAFPTWIQPGKSGSVLESLSEATSSPEYVTCVWLVPEPGARGLAGATLVG